MAEGGTPPGILQAGAEEFPPLPLTSRHFQKERNQFLADWLIADISSCGHSGSLLCLGITVADLLSPKMNFMSGLACTGKALISTSRL